ncbi:MAG TPA: rRNA maturation RNase YbeY [bacterium]|nr:rRNA maturation RNase YbeY [bacterium]
MDQIFNRTKHSLNQSHYLHLLFQLKNYAHLPEQSIIELHFVSESIIKNINRDYRHIDHSTDVLSFPVDVAHLTTDHPYIFGTIFVCPNYIIKRDQTDQYDSYIIHSFVHLLGFDHQVQKEELIFNRKTKNIFQYINNHV